MARVKHDQMLRFCVTEEQRELIRTAALMRAGNVGEYLRSVVVADAQRNQETYPAIFDHYQELNRKLRSRRREGKP